MQDRIGTAARRPFDGQSNTLRRLSARSRSGTNLIVIGRNGSHSELVLGLERAVSLVATFRRIRELC